mmetsp:Transcript_69405/g.166402  ORF Transcript_69405/g.166402 Transcript_69405/m.166402 type:complete len:278 (+) Transcript_69405:123-956(+)
MQNSSEAAPLVTNPSATQFSNADPGFVEQGGNSSNNANRSGPPPTTNIMNLIWFGAAVAIMILAVLGLIYTFLNFEWLDSLQFIFLFIFGFVLAVMDTPIFSNIRLVPDLRMAISRYFNIIMRVTGKGVVLLFVGASLWMTLWANERASNFILVLTVVLCLPVILIGIASIGIGVMKSMQLDKVRTRLRQDAFPQGASNQGAVQSVISDLYNQYAKMQPEIGMTKSEFNQMSKHFRGVEFQDQDLKLIFVALASHPKRENLTQVDLADWIYGAIVFL